MTEAEELELLELEEEERLAKEKTSAEKPGILEAGLRGAADYTTLSHGDELAGAAAHPLGGIKALFGQGSDDPDVKAYQQERDASRALYDRAAEAHPVAYHGAGVASSVLGPGKILKGLQAGKAVLGASALGGMAGLGHSKAELADKEYGQAATDTATGAALGAGAQYGLNKIAPLAQAAGQKMAPVIDKLPAAAGQIAEKGTYAAGAALGHKSGIPGGELGGAYLASKVAKPIGQSVQQATGRVLSLVRGTPFQEPLSTAAARGGNSFGVTYYMLHQNYPEFRTLLEKSGGNQ